MQLKALLVLVLALPVAQHSQVFAHQKEVIDCPATFQFDRDYPEEIPSGWRATLLSKMPGKSDGVEEAKLFSGPPEEMAEMVPDHSTDKTATWTELDNEFDLKRHFWVACYYGNSTFALFKEVQIHPAKCIVSVENGNNIIGKLVRFTCTR